MTLFDINQAVFPWKERRLGYSAENNNIDLSEITTVYTTFKQEPARSGFIGVFNLFENIDQYEPIRGTRYAADGTRYGDNNSYWEDKPYDDAYDYWSTITSEETKDLIRSKFGLEEEEYDALACIALALASQETGMGFEEGYQEENGKDRRTQDKRNSQIEILNFLDTKDEGLDPLVIASKVAGLIGINIPQDAQSASSGLTQMKIHDILNDPKNQSSLLSRTLEEFGITSESATVNNLAKEPQKAALATMAYLATLLKDHKEYEGAMSTYHEQLGDKISQETGLTYDEALQKGYESVLTIYEKYNEIDDIEAMKKFRDIAKNWMLSTNNSTLEKTDNLSQEELLALVNSPENKFNEEAQLILLNSYFKDSEFDSESLECIRLFLSHEGMAMSPLEYIPHAWNTGADLHESEQFNKYDRFFTSQLGIILSNPETFQYDQFTPSVVELAKLYASQGSLDGYYAIEDTLDNYTDMDERYPWLSQN
ncbi:MAG: hypothetical protein IJB79_05930 [Candidatus Gastranaerophilales bacterium]|nr:hypothetical protein [Candidatus Gastranaerophilales bacterium]